MWVATKLSPHYLKSAFACDISNICWTVVHIPKIPHSWQSPRLTGKIWSNWASEHAQHADAAQGICHIFHLSCFGQADGVNLGEDQMNRIWYETYMFVNQIDIDICIWLYIYIYMIVYVYMYICILYVYVYVCIILSWRGSQEMMDFTIIWECKWWWI